MSAKHTPAPWTVTRQEDYDGRTKNMFVERIGPWHIEWHADLNKQQPDRIEADIALTRAAPALLKAARKVLKGLETRIAAASATGAPVPIFDGIADLHAAIGKATKVSS